MVALFLISAGTGHAQDDPGCKDHPLLSRMPNFYIDSCENREFDQYQFPDARENWAPVEGTYYWIKYVLKDGAQAPSELQIVRNYIQAIQKMGGRILLERRDQAYLRVDRGGATTWIHVEAHSVGTAYNVVIVEKKAMVQEVTAGDMLAALNKQGSVALYINFDTDKATIKPESRPIIDQIVKLLEDNPGLAVGVEGHTDSTGTPAGNRTLSQQRAESVVVALVKAGIDGKRLSAAGWGQDRPVADNGTEEGRARNRRVEIVRK